MHETEVTGPPASDSHSEIEAVDVLVVGGGPAGLSGALVLARARRRVLVCDHGIYRNARARALHGYLSRDGVPPTELIRIGRDELARYGVDVARVEVRSACHVPGGGFAAELANGRTVRARKLLIATGVCDRLPAIEGIESLYGISVHHCPYCDGFEWRDHRLAVYGRGQGGAELAHSMLSWSDDVVLLTGGPRRLRASAHRELVARGVRVDERPLVRLEGEDGRLRHVVFDRGEPLERDALFFSTSNDQSCALGATLGCRFTTKGSLWTDARGRASVPDVFIAGDASRDVQFAIVAAAEGAKAAVAIHRELQHEERQRAREGAGAAMAAPTR